MIGRPEKRTALAAETWRGSWLSWFDEEGSAPHAEAGGLSEAADCAGYDLALDGAALYVVGNNATEMVLIKYYR